MQRKYFRITLRDIAEKADFSVNTVSKVLSGQSADARISPATARIIKKLADQMGYVPNQLARNLRAKRTGLIGVFISDMTDPTYAGIAHAVLENLSKNDLFPLLTVAEAGLELCRESWIRNRIDGLILCGTTSEMTTEFFRDLEREGLTAVIAGNFYTDPTQGLSTTPPVSTAHVNNQVGIQLAINHLLEQGRKKIAFIAGPHSHSDAAQRQTAYETLIKPHHKPIIADVTTEEQFWRRGYHAAEMLNRGKEQFDAVIAYDDLTAIGAMRYLNEHGISIPDDIAVIGFDNLPQCEYTIPSLSSIEPPVEMVGRKSVELLKSHLGSQGALEHVLSTPSLVVRESTLHRVALKLSSKRVKRK